MRAIIVATALLVIALNAAPSQASRPFQIAFGINGQHPSGLFHPPVNFGYYNGHHAMTFPVPGGYQPWTQPGQWGHPRGQFYYYYDPSFSGYGAPSAPGVRPFDGWDVQPNNIIGD